MLFEINKVTIKTKTIDNKYVAMCIDKVADANIKAVKPISKNDRESFRLSLIRNNKLNDAADIEYKKSPAYDGSSKKPLGLNTRLLNPPVSMPKINCFRNQIDVTKNPNMNARNNKRWL